MADKFGFGAPKMQVGINQDYPGFQTSSLGTRLLPPGLPVDGFNYGFGEIVKIVANYEKAYSFRALTTADTAEALAVVFRDQVGGTVYNDEIISSAKRNVACSLWLLNEDQYGGVVVPAGEAIADGGAIFVGLGTGGKVAGAVYATADGAHTVALTGFVAVGNSYAPSTTSALAVKIAKKLDI